MEHERHFLLSSICCTLCFIFPFLLQCHFIAVMNVLEFLYIVKLLLLAQLESDSSKYKIKRRLVCQKGGLSGVMLLSLASAEQTLLVSLEGEEGAGDEQKKTTYCMFFYTGIIVILVSVPKVTDLNVCVVCLVVTYSCRACWQTNWYHLCWEGNNCLHS